MDTRPTTPLLDATGEPMEDDSGFLLPHHRTFSAIWNTISKTYPYTWDEALKHSKANALAMPRDAFLMGCLFERILQLAELPWHLEPENQKDSRQVQETKEMTHIVKATPRWIQFMTQMGWTTWYGRYGTQHIWGKADVNGRPRLCSKNHEPVNGDKIQFGWDGTPRVYVSHMWLHQNARPGSRLHKEGLIDNYPEEWLKKFPERDALLNASPQKPVILGDRAPMLVLRDPLWRQRFTIHKHMCIDADYFDAEMSGGVHGVGLRSLVYWFFWIRDEMIGWAINHMKKIGVGGILIFYYPEGNDKAKTAAENAARDAGERYALAMPQPTGSSKNVESAQLLPFNEAGVTALKDIVETYYERHIERLMIGQTLTSKPAGGGLGDGTATLHADTKYRILKFDALNLADTLTEDFVRVIQKGNFPQSKYRVRFVFDIPDPEGKEKIANAKAIWDMGGKVKADSVYGAGGIDKAEEDDATLSQAQMQKTQMDMESQAQQQQAQSQGQQQQAEAQQQMQVQAQKVQAEQHAAIQKHKMGLEHGAAEHKQKMEQQAAMAAQKHEEGAPPAHAWNPEAPPLNLPPLPANQQIVAMQEVESVEYATEIEQAAADAESEPSHAQKKAGNYRMGHVSIQGLPITIENAKGSIRKGRGWEQEMNHHYGYIKRTESEADGDHIDVFIGEHPDSDVVFVVDQTKKDGSFDEHKCMIGFQSAQEAKDAYLSNYAKDWTGFGDITAMTMDDFKRWLKEGDTGKSLAPVEYAWDEGEHSRDHGKFSQRPGGGRQGEEKPASLDPRHHERIQEKLQRDRIADSRIRSADDDVDYEKERFAKWKNKAHREGAFDQNHPVSGTDAEYVREVYTERKDLAGHAADVLIKLLKAIIIGAMKRGETPNPKHIERLKTLQKYAESLAPVEYAATHAPKGGATIAGKKFVGGQFIPSAVMAKATPQEKARLQQRQQAQQAPSAPAPTAPQSAPQQPAQPEPEQAPAPTQMVPDEQLHDLLSFASSRTIQGKEHHLPHVLQAVQRIAKLAPREYASAAGRAYQRSAAAAALGQITQDTYDANAFRVVEKYRHKQGKSVGDRTQLQPVSRAAQAVATEAGRAAGAVANPILKHVIGETTQGMVGKDKLSKAVHRVGVNTSSNLASKGIAQAIGDVPHFIHWLRQGMPKEGAGRAAGTVGKLALTAGTAALLGRQLHKKFTQGARASLTAPQRREMLAAAKVRVEARRQREAAAAAPAPAPTPQAPPNARRHPWTGRPVWQDDQSPALYLLNQGELVPVIYWEENQHNRDHGKFSKTEGAKGEQEAPAKSSRPLAQKFDRYKQALTQRGDAMGTGHKRIAIPKTNLTEDEINQLGFQRSMIAVPESGQDRFASWRHPEGNYHLHSHPDHWLLHQDEHPSLTVALAKAKTPGEKATALRDGLSHIFGEGVPGLGHYLKNQVTGGGKMAEVINKGAVLKGGKKAVAPAPTQPGWFKRNRKTIAIAAAAALIAAAGGYAAHRSLRRKPGEGPSTPSAPTETSSGPVLPSKEWDGERWVTKTEPESTAPAPSEPLPAPPSLKDAFNSIIGKHNQGVEAVTPKAPDWTADPHATSSQAMDEITKLATEGKKQKTEQEKRQYRLKIAHAAGKAMDDLKKRLSARNEPSAYDALKDLRSHVNAMLAMFAESDSPAAYVADDGSVRTYADRDVSKEARDAGGQWTKGSAGGAARDAEEDAAARKRLGVDKEGKPSGTPSGPPETAKKKPRSQPRSQKVSIGDLVADDEEEADLDALIAERRATMPAHDSPDPTPAQEKAEARENRRYWAKKKAKAGKNARLQEVAEDVEHMGSLDLQKPKDRRTFEQDAPVVTSNISDHITNMVQDEAIGIVKDEVRGKIVQHTKPMADAVAAKVSSTATSVKNAVVGLFKKNPEVATGVGTAVAGKAAHSALLGAGVGAAEVAAVSTEAAAAVSATTATIGTGTAAIASEATAGAAAAAGGITLGALALPAAIIAGIAASGYAAYHAARVGAKAAADAGKKFDKDEAVRQAHKRDGKAIVRDSILHGKQMAMVLAGAKAGSLNWLKNTTAPGLIGQLLGAWQAEEAAVSYQGQQ